MTTARSSRRTAPRGPPATQTALAPALAVALALTTASLTTAIAGRLPPPRLPAGVYYGWTDGADGRFRVLGAPCPSSPHGDDSIAGATLTSGGNEVAFASPAVEPTVAQFAAAPALPVLTFDPSALRGLVGDERLPGGATIEVGVTRLTVTCRSHAQSSVRLGRAAFAIVAATDAHAVGLDVLARPVPPAGELLGVLVLNNRTDATITLRSLSYAPRAAATGMVLAAAGDASLLPTWLGAADGAPIGPWHASYQPPDDQRRLRERAANDLDLDLGPGDVAVIVVDRDALRTTLVSRPVLLYPVLAYTREGQTVSFGLTTPLYGVTRSWR